MIYVKTIKAAVEEPLVLPWTRNQIGLDFRVIAHDADRNLDSVARQFIRKRGRFDTLFTGLLASGLDLWRVEYGLQGAVYLIVDERLDNPESVAGEAVFNSAYAVSSLANRRRNGYLRQMAGHEAGHLLGFQHHHELWSVDDYDLRMPCTMRYDGGDHFCPMCLDGVLSYWTAVEKRTGERFRVMVSRSRKKQSIPER